MLQLPKSMHHLNFFNYYLFILIKIILFFNFYLLKCQLIFFVLVAGLLGPYNVDAVNILFYLQYNTLFYGFLNGFCR